MTRGGDYLILDDPLKPDEAVSEAQRRAVNHWYEEPSCWEHQLSSN